VGSTLSIDLKQRTNTMELDLIEVKNFKSGMQISIEINLPLTAGSNIQTKYSY